jgi:hypothetical protein
MIDGGCQNRSTRRIRRLLIIIVAAATNSGGRGDQLAGDPDPAEVVTPGYANRKRGEIFP